MHKGEKLFNVVSFHDLSSVGMYQFLVSGRIPDNYCSVVFEKSDCKNHVKQLLLHL